MLILPGGKVGVSDFEIGRDSAEFSMLLGTGLWGLVSLLSCLLSSPGHTYGKPVWCVQQLV